LHPFQTSDISTTPSPGKTLHANIVGIDVSIRVGLQTLATCKESIPNVCATKGTCDVEFLGDLFHADVAVVVGGYEFVDEEAVVQAKEAHEGVMSEGVREE